MPSIEIQYKARELGHYLSKLDHIRDRRGNESAQRIILELAEDIFLSDCKHAERLLLDEMIWRKIFLPQIQTAKLELERGNQLIPNSATDNMARSLKMASTFYRLLVLELSHQYGLDLSCIGSVSATSTNDERYALSIVYKSLILLGDVDRFSNAYSATRKTWKRSGEYYRKAFHINPSGGKPHSHMGLLASYEGNNLDTFYYYSLRFAFSNLVWAMYRLPKK